MADALSLLFELDADGRPAVAEFQRIRKAFAGEIASLRKTVAQSFTLPPIKLPTAPTVSGRGNQADAHVKEFRRIEAEQKRSTQAQEKEQRRLNAAVQSLQRQRSAALIRAFKDEERAAVASARAQERAAQQASRSIANAFRGIGPGLQSIGRTLTVGITAPLAALGAISLKSAKDLDANVNTLKAFTGSAEAAERRLAQLIKTARDTPGLTTNLALTLDAQLRVAQTTEETINRVLPAIGRLNAVSKLPDAGRFTQNLLQLVTQNFERQDLKELVGQSPLAGQLLTEIFNVDSPTNAKAIREQAKKLGLTTVDSFFAAFADAAQRNQGLATVTESIGTRFEKVVDRVTVALRPLGLAIINAIEPFVEPVAKLVERIGSAFDSLSAPVKTAIIVIAGLAAAAGPVLFILGSIATAIASVVSAIGTIGTVVAAVGLPAIAAAIAAIVIVIGRTILIVALLAKAWQTNFLGIRELTANAASAVLDAFTRIKAVFDEATQRLLPTLESITTKVLGAITILWERYGSTVVRVISTSFEIVVRTLEAFARFFGNAVDLVAKLIDNDWRGAWRAFSRIIINALDSITEFFDKALRALAQGFIRLHAFIIRQAVTFVEAGKELAAKLITSIAIGIIAGAPQISDALAKMLLLAVLGVAVRPIGQALVARLLEEMRKAAAESAAIVAAEQLAAAQQRGSSLAEIRQLDEDRLNVGVKKPPPKTPGDVDKGADAETRRRIRLLELEAERAEAIARQRIAAENIFFEQRKTSLKDFTDFQIKEEEIVLEKKKKVFAAERVEAEKLGKGRDLALGEIRLKELKAEIEFQDRRNQLLANQQREELEAAKAHRQALLEIQETADDAELARLEGFRRQGALTAFDLEARRAEIEAAARRRRREELEIQKREAGDNKEERERITDELKKFDAKSAAATEDAERRKREAIQETADAYREYVLTIREALEATREATRTAAAIVLTRLNARAFLTERQRIQRQFAIEAKALEADKRASDLRIDNDEREAVARAKAAGELEGKLLEIEKTFNQRRLAEQKRFQQEKAKLDEDRKAALERTDPNSTRSLFGDTFADFGDAIRAAAERAGVAVSNLTVILGGFGAAAAEHFANASAQAGNFISILLDGVDQITAGLGDMLQNWVLLGETGSAAFRKLLASTLAYYAKSFLIKALDNIGEGFSNLAKAFAAAGTGNFASAALYKAAATQNFISAAKYGIASAATAVAGRFAAGDSFRQDTASRAVSGGQDAEPRNATFNFGGPGAVETSSQALRDGSAGIIGRAVAPLVDRIEAIEQAKEQRDNARTAIIVRAIDHNTQALTTIETAKPDDVIMKASPATVARQNLQGAKENYDIVFETLQLQNSR